MRTILIPLVGLIACGCSRAPSMPAPAATSPQLSAVGSRPWTAKPRPVAAIDRVVIISVDGLRPDLLLWAETSRLHGLIKSSTYTFWAETAPEAYTLPCHVSMLTG